MDLETAEISLIGDRADNQDRAQILVGDAGMFVMVADGMGGHAHGALAAETAIAALDASFRQAQSNEADAPDFLPAAIAAAHREVFALGDGMAADTRPGTIVVCALASGKALHWAHVGDSRAYHLRNGKLLTRTRDHSVIETLIESGKITREQAATHPDRHLVEYCLGVTEETPPIEVGKARRLAPGDIVLLCSDGFWDQLEETHMIETLSRSDKLQELLNQLAEEAVSNAQPHSDNVTALALRALSDKEASA
ncbi:MAG: PP2C family protein-serine/threonine phosphatase [Gammaproteobacteria bacterium]